MSTATAVPESTGQAKDSLRHGVIALIAFLTLVDLFAAQAILPSLALKYGVPPSAMGVAVNLSTLGMAAAGFAIAVFGRRIDRHSGIWVSLALLSLPTTLLAFTENLQLFAILRIAQGICMASAFTLTMAYLGERFTAAGTTTALAAYVTGNVASNVFGRMLSAFAAEQFGIATSFLVFAALNLIGAGLAYLALCRTQTMMKDGVGRMRFGANLREILRNRQLSHAFAVGFLVLFVFIGTYTYVNFRLVAAPLALSPMMLGLVYLVFLPSLVTTPLAGRLSDAMGASAAIAVTLVLAIAGLLLCLSARLPLVLAGLTLIAIGTFQAQAIATGHVSRSAGDGNRPAASGLYLSSYYAGGLAGSFVLGQVHDGLGWEACIFTLCAALVLAIGAAASLRAPTVSADYLRLSERSQTGIGIGRPSPADLNP